MSSRLYYSFNDENTTAMVIGCDLDYEGDVTVPERIDGYTVIGISENAFRYCSLVTSISLPETISSIGEYAFCECNQLININIPDAITTISKGCFKECKSLVQIDFNNVTTVQDYAFAECSAFNMNIPETIVSVGTRAFHHSGLTSLNISANMTRIYFGAFSWCPLESLSIDKNNPNYIIEDDVLYSKDKTELVLYPPFKTDVVFSIPETVMFVHEYAFEENYYMETLRINNGIYSLSGLGGLMNIKNFECYNGDSTIEITEYGYYTAINNFTGKKYLFYNDSLCRIPVDETTFTFPESTTPAIDEYITNVRSGAFAGCVNLTEVDSTKPYAYYNEIPYKLFYKCENLSLSDNMISNEVCSIQDYAFAECKKITSVYLNLPTSISMSDGDYVGNYAFYNCSSLIAFIITTIPEILTLKSHAFENCEMLNYVRRQNTRTGVLTAEKYAFKNVPSSQSTLSCEVFNNEILGYFGFKIETPFSTDKTLWEIWNAQPNVVSIILGEGMSQIMSYAFSNENIQRWSFEKLEYIKFPSSITQVGYHAFYYTELPMNTFDFSNCTQISFINTEAFSHVDGLSISLNNIVKINSLGFSDVKFSDTNMNIIKDSSTINIHSYAFNNCEGIGNIEVQCDTLNLGTASANGSVSYYNAGGNYVSDSYSRSISDGFSFYGGNSETINIRCNNFNSTGNNLFSYNNTLTDFHLIAETVSDNMASCNYMASECPNLLNATISGVIPDYMFGSSFKLKKIKFYNMSDTVIVPYGAIVSQCIQELDFSESKAQTINMNTKNGYFGQSKLCCLKKILFPDTLMDLTLMSYGIKGDKLQLPESLTTLYIHEFCYALTEISIPKNVTTINYSKTSIRKLKVPNNCVVNGCFRQNSIPIKITYY